MGRDGTVWMILFKCVRISIRGHICPLVDYNAQSNKRMEGRLHRPIQSMNNKTNPELYSCPALRQEMDQRCYIVRAKLQAADPKQKKNGAKIFFR